MKKILYLTNIEVPYRVRFFNELAKHCDLTVMYERRKSANRNATWASREEKIYQVEYLDGRNIGDENSFSSRICGVVKRGWDAIIVGCYNSKAQMLAMMYMRLKHIPFYINLDGEAFIGAGWKAKAKCFFLKGAKGYLVAGEKSCESLMQVVGGKQLTPPCKVQTISLLSHTISAA